MNTNEKKSSARCFLIYIHLFISFIIVIGESFNGFKNILMAYHSLNFEENFLKRKFYYIDDYHRKKEVIYSLEGFMEDSLPKDFKDPFETPNNIELRRERQKELKEKYKDRIISFRTREDYGKYFEKDEKGRTYINVWYNPKLEKVYSINYMGVDTDPFLFHFLFTIWIIPEIWYLRILRKRKKRALLENKNNLTQN